jgi:hypothetical protein
MDCSQYASRHYRVFQIGFLSFLLSVEVRLRPAAATRYDTIRNLVHKFITSFDRIGLPSTLDGWQDAPELASSVERIVVSESSCPSNTLSLEEMALQIHVYQPSNADSFEDFSNSSSVRDDDDDTTAASVSDLPNRSWEGLWDSLIYADDIKMKLLDYIHATMVFSDANVDCEVHPWLVVCVLTCERNRSQSHFVEPRRSFARPAWYWKNLTLPCTCAKALYTPLTSVEYTSHAILPIRTHLYVKDIRIHVCSRSILILCFRNGFPNPAS